MKILCLCQGGNVRSGALATLLKDWGHDALAAGIEWNTRETVEMLCKWADVITIAEDWIIKSVPIEHIDKVSTEFIVGPDRFGIAIHPELLAHYCTLIAGVPRGPRGIPVLTPIIEMETSN